MSAPTSIEVKLPFKGVTPKDEVEEICRIVQSAPELGFVYKAVVEDAIAQNSVRGTLWAVYIDGTPAGAAMIGSRRPYDHLYRTGDVTVLKEWRRKRLGTALYLATAMQGVLEGRREAEETVIASLSPWMVYAKDDAGFNGMPNYDGLLDKSSVDGDGFLRSLNYQFYGTLPKRTGGFRDIQLWCHSPLALEDYIKRLPETVYDGVQTTVELVDTEFSKTVFERNMKNYDQHDKQLAEAFNARKAWLMSGADGIVRVLQVMANV